MKFEKAMLKSLLKKGLITYIEYEKSLSLLNKIKKAKDLKSSKI